MDFASKIAFHQRQAIASALIELGCVEETSFAENVTIEPQPAPYQVQQNSTTKEILDRRIYQVCM